MDLDKAEQLQLLLDLTTETINELAVTVDLEQMDSLELFQEAVSQAIIQYQFVTRKPKKASPIGRVDTTKMAFCLLDNETAAVIQGNLDFADNIDLDLIGGDEPEEGEPYDD
jgi:hypothetical protein